jgi:hypothetical protein
MAENQLPDEFVQKLDPNRRKFILGILAAGITAPSVASFVMGKANKSTIIGNPIRPASLIDSSGNFNIPVLFSGNLYSSSANYVYPNYSGNFLRDASGNFLLDPSGNLLCGTSGNILLDLSGNAIPDPSGNIAYLANPSGNWAYDYSSNTLRIPYRDASGNAQSYYGLDMDPSGNKFTDNYFPYDSNGVINYGSTPQIPGLACVVSANHLRQVQVVPTTSTVAPTTTSTVAPTTTSTVAPTTTSTVAPTTTNPGVNQNGSGSSATTVPVTPIRPGGSIPATR